MAPVERTKWMTSTWDCTPSIRWHKIGAHAPSKNDLKWPKIKQVTNSNLYYIKFEGPATAKNFVQDFKSS